MSSTSTVVETTYGPVRGVDHGYVKAWKGIRYAAPPVGDLRWRAPEPPERWTRSADASRFAGVCPQPPVPVIPFELGAPESEDCLFLNVWAPALPGDSKPVMVWVHGGAYILGSGSQPLYDGSVLASSGNAIVVTINYRLGAFGFLDPSTSGSARRRHDTNVGLRDVIFALQWVRDNIAAFGGDPDRVTLFGESAGTGVVTTLLTSPPAAGLFAGAVAQSSSATSVYETTRAAGSWAWCSTDSALTMRRSIGCTPCPAMRSLPRRKPCSMQCRCRRPAGWRSHRSSTATSSRTTR